MEIVADAVIPFSRELVYTTYRDRLPELVDYLPNVDAIEVLESRREGPLLHLVNRWVGSARVPRFMRHAIKPEWLSWNDIAVWYDDEWACEWRIDNPRLERQVRVSGRNTFVEESPGRCRFEIRGELHLDGTSLPGVPSLIGRRLAPQIERFIVALIRPNLIKTADGVRRFLASNQGNE